MNVYGYYKVIGGFLKKNSKKITLVVMANDHSPTNQCIIENCLKYGIRTLYIQHASINEQFPPNRFTYSFLDGLDSYRKYVSIRRCTGAVFLSGSSRFDALKKYGRSPGYIGVAINMIDDLEMVFALCKKLADNGIRSVIIRPHPRLELKRDWMERLIGIGADFSDARTEDPFSFMARLKLLISNESSIHLEALLMQIPSVQYNFSKQPFEDHYSFVRKNIVPLYESFEGVLAECITPHKVCSDSIKEYNAAFGTRFDGNVSGVISDFIQEFENGTEDAYVNAVFSYNQSGYYEYKQNLYEKKT